MPFLRHQKFHKQKFLNKEMASPSLTHPPCHPSTPHSPLPTPHSPLKMSRLVLLVDDEADVRAIAQLGLEIGAGWRVLIATSGQEAIELAALHQPDVILLDWMMPGMDGRETVRQLKNNIDTQKIPVILMTAKVQQSDQGRFEGLDVAAFFAKPFRPLKLADQIREALGWEE